MIETAGRWNPADQHVYFLASKPHILIESADLTEFILVAVNEIEGDYDRECFDRLVSGGKHRVFLDSGVYWLAIQHAKAHGLSHNAALRMQPEQIDGFEQHFARYCQLLDQYGDRLWGYIELDLGGPSGKARTRNRLEALGYRPIPVYHPLGDGWDYFDALASRYDRLCLGNIVMARPAERLRLFATMAERRRQHRGLRWIHALGMTPNEIVNAYPLESTDSSSWLSAVRWAPSTDRCAGASMGKLPTNFNYALGTDRAAPHGYLRALRLSALIGTFVQRNWREHVAALSREGL